MTKPAAGRAAAIAENLTANPFWAWIREFFTAITTCRSNYQNNPRRAAPAGASAARPGTGGPTRHRGRIHGATRPDRSMSRLHRHRRRGELLRVRGRPCLPRPGLPCRRRRHRLAPSQCLTTSTRPTSAQRTSWSPTICATAPRHRRRCAAARQARQAHTQRVPTGTGIRCAPATMDFNERCCADPRLAPAAGSPPRR